MAIISRVFGTWRTLMAKAAAATGAGTGREGKRILKAHPVSQPLAGESRPAAVWDYVKLQNLQNPANEKEISRFDTRREVTVMTIIPQETLQHVIDDLEKCDDDGIGSKTNEEAKQLISSLTRSLEENEVLINDAVVALAELKASLLQPNEDLTKEKMINALKVLGRL